MARATRSKLALLPSNSETESSRITRKNSTVKTGKNALESNSSSSVKSARIAKNSEDKAPALRSKLHATKKDPSLVNGNSLMIMKSPVLRDRTNTANELIKVNVHVEKLKEVKASDEKKLVKTAVKRNTKTVAKKKKVQNENAIEQSTEKPKIAGTFKKVISEKNFDSLKVKQNEKDTQVSNNYNNENNIKLLSDKNVECQDENRYSNRVLRKKNLSIEAVERLLNDEELDCVSNEENIQIKSEVEKINNEVPAKTEGNKVNKKFFKYKNVEKEMETVPVVKTLQGKVNKHKKGTKVIETDDSSFSPVLNESQSAKPTYSIRSRVNKNYCELTMLSPESTSNASKEVDAEKNKEKSISNTAKEVDAKKYKEESTSNAAKDLDAEKNKDVDKNLKKVPIYKTIRLSQENVKAKEEVYNYLDDSPEGMDQKGKKRRKVVKKPKIKRVRKAASSKVAMDQKLQKKEIKKIPTNVQFKKQDKIPLNTQQNIIKNTIQSNTKVLPRTEDDKQTDVEVPERSKQIIPEHLLNAGDSTIAEASTIKIISVQKLDGSQKINLTSTPLIPKTIASELKFFGTKNGVTSKPSAQYKNMVNHSLIRESMSPITKTVDDFDIGSPWRVIDAFSRVNKVVQSTPQINRLPSTREKKLPVHILNLNKKSLNSEETKHMSSIMEDKLSEKQKTPIIPTKNQNDVLSRKFGTTISNLNSTPIKSVNNSNRPIQNNISSSIHNQEDSMIPENYKENTVASPAKSPQKKINTPSPFRFEKIRTSKRLESKTSKFTVQEKLEENELKAGPSCSEKSKPIVLRQSNLDNFLNLNEVPESTRISTEHGIFDDVHSTPITGKKSKNLIEEANVHNAFGFDDDEISETILSKDKSFGSIIATEQDIKRSVKGKLFPKARVKSFMPSRISENAIKKTLRNVITKKQPESKQCGILKKSDESDCEKENEIIKKDTENNEYKKSPEEEALNAVSFSDTFDVFSETGELQSRVPEEIPLFVDLEPVHFTKPPRRSYNKRKRAVHFNTSKEDFESDEEDHEQKKSKKKKVSKVSKEENKRMQEWLSTINKSFQEIDHYDLVIE